MLKNASINDYEIIKEIGKGSFSNVFLVKKKINQKEYALKKVNLSGMSTKERENAIKEVNFLAEIKDSNVIGYEESFYDNNMSILYLVMEYASYGDLNKIITNNNKLKIYFSESELLNIYLQIASGLKAIHSKHIIHRDLKSANIFITQKNDLILKIGDFNVSKKIDYFNLKNTQTGTPYYASPEIWENKPYDLKSDIWSLGCLFYEIASLTTPFKGLNMKELFECIEKGIFAPLPKQYSNNITKLIKMCLRHNADMRPDSAHVKYFIENLKSEQHFKSLFDENYFSNNTINKTNFQKNTLKRPISYIKKSTNLNLNLEPLELPDLDNSNSKNKNIRNIIKHNDIGNIYLKNLNIINEKKKRNLTPIKINYHYFVKDRTLEKTNLNSINNDINNKVINIKDNYINNNNNFKSEKNINNEINTPEKIKKEYNTKLKPPPYKLLKIINNEFEEKNKIKNEKEKDNKNYNNNNINHNIKDEYEQNHLAQKFSTIKNPLKQIDNKISVNNSQSIPEVINNSDSQNSQNYENINKNLNVPKEINKHSINIVNTNNDLNKKIYNYNNFNYDTKIEDANNNININNKPENNYKKNINIKTNNNKDILLLLKPNGYFFQKKPLKSLSTINIKNKRPISSFITRSTLNNNSDNINKIFEGYNNTNTNNTNNTNTTIINNNKNIKNLSKIKLKPIIPPLRSITPFNEHVEKNESKIGNNKMNYILLNKKSNNSINDLNYNNISEINNISNNNIQNNYNNDKRYFLKEKKNIRQLNFNKNKLNNLSQIKTKFINFIKPNYKNIDMIYNKTEI